MVNKLLTLCLCSGQYNSNPHSVQYISNPHSGQYNSNPHVPRVVNIFPISVSPQWSLFLCSGQLLSLPLTKLNHTLKYVYICNI